MALFTNGKKDAIVTIDMYLRERVRHFFFSDIGAAHAAYPRMCVAPLFSQPVRRETAIQRGIETSQTGKAEGYWNEEAVHDARSPLILSL